jgi:Tfp pilus assembly protein PilO
MNDEKPLTGIRKRQQIANTNKQMFIWVAVAAVVVVVCVVLGMNFVQRIIYQAKVNGKIGETAKTLSSSVEAIKDLTTEINKIKDSSADLKLPNLKSDNSTELQVILDALPTEDDRTALGASLQQKVLTPSGVSIEQISVTESSGYVINSSQETTTTSSSVKPTAQPITFSLVLDGSYSAIQSAISDIEKTIRPITINSIDLQGTDDKLQATIGATTYYVPKVNYQLGSEEITP